MTATNGGVAVFEVGTARRAKVGTAPLCVVAGRLVGCEGLHQGHVVREEQVAALAGEAWHPETHKSILAGALTMPSGNFYLTAESDQEDRLHILTAEGSKGRRQEASWSLLTPLLTTMSVALFKTTSARKHSHTMVIHAGHFD